MKFPKMLQIGSSGLLEEYTAEEWSDVERDPRGVVLAWEPPMPKAHYIMGLDPTEGITGWSRSTMVSEDVAHQPDNGVIEIFRVNGEFDLIYKEQDGRKVPDIDPQTGKQRRKYMDVQVAELAAPCDAVEIARMAYLLGSAYCGDEEDRCELVWEAWPGPGLLTTQELLRLGYSNLWEAEYIDNVAKANGRIGWFSSRESQRFLWNRCRRHLMEKKVLIQSKHLLGEYANAEIDTEKMRARAASGFKDDRFQAANMALWAGHKWTYNEEHHETVTEKPLSDYQLYAPTLDEHTSYSEWKENCMADYD